MPDQGYWSLVSRLSNGNVYFQFNGTVSVFRYFVFINIEASLFFCLKSAWHTPSLLRVTNQWNIRNIYSLQISIIFVSFGGAGFHFLFSSGISRLVCVLYGVLIRSTMYEYQDCDHSNSGAWVTYFWDFCVSSPDH